MLALGAAAGEQHGAEARRGRHPGQEEGDEGQEPAQEARQAAEDPQRAPDRERQEEQGQAAQDVVVGVRTPEPLDPLVPPAARREDFAHGVSRGQVARHRGQPDREQEEGEHEPGDHQHDEDQEHREEEHLTGQPHAEGAAEAVAGRVGHRLQLRAEEIHGEDAQQAEHQEGAQGAGDVGRRVAEVVRHPVEEAAVPVPDAGRARPRPPLGRRCRGRRRRRGGRLGGAGAQREDLAGDPSAGLLHRPSHLKQVALDSGGGLEDQRAVQQHHVAAHGARERERAVEQRQVAGDRASRGDRVVVVDDEGEPLARVLRRGPQLLEGKPEALEPAGERLEGERAGSDRELVPPGTGDGHGLGRRRVGGGRRRGGAEDVAQPLAQAPEGGRLLPGQLGGLPLEQRVAQRGGRLADVAAQETAPRGLEGPARLVVAHGAAVHADRAPAEGDRVLGAVGQLQLELGPGAGPRGDGHRAAHDARLLGLLRGSVARRQEDGHGDRRGDAERAPPNLSHAPSHMARVQSTHRLPIGHSAPFSLSPPATAPRSRPGPVASSSTGRHNRGG